MTKIPVTGWNGSLLWGFFVLYALQKVQKHIILIPHCGKQVII